ncbi:MAG: ribonuclease HII [Burkholderiaceae bacterium]
MRADKRVVRSDASAGRQASFDLLPQSGLVCGVDEAGRGPLVGAVVAAAVILDPSRPIEGLADSKVLSEKKRDALAIEIRSKALAWCVAQASPGEIDELNILHATMLAMQRAVHGLAVSPNLARIDGNRAPGLPCAVETLVGGDALDPSISAASILAKTVRDAQMRALHQLYPVFGFDRHKGYPTAEHRRLLAQHGPCAEHRRSFRPVADALKRMSNGARGG